MWRWSRGPSGGTTSRPTTSNNVSSRQPHPCTLGTMTTVLVVAAAIVIATPIVFACVIRDGARRNQAQEGGNNEGGQ